VTANVDQRLPKRSRYLYPAFIASLALNLLFIGGIAAAYWHNTHDYKRVHGMMVFVNMLPADRQPVVRAQVQAVRDSLKDLKASVRKSWTASNDLLTAEPFDKEKFKASMTQLRDVAGQYKTALNNALADMAEKFSPAERKLLHDWRENRRPWLHRKGHDKKHE
jgi:uncharacterized membrane protein